MKVKLSDGSSKPGGGGGGGTLNVEVIGTLIGNIFGKP